MLLLIFPHGDDDDVVVVPGVELLLLVVVLITIGGTAAGTLLQLDFTRLAVLVPPPALLHICSSCINIHIKCMHQVGGYMIPIDIHTYGLVVVVVVVSSFMHELRSIPCKTYTLMMSRRRRDTPWWVSPSCSSS